MTSPAQRDNPPGFSGLPHPTILAACALLGVSEVYAVGGAQAVAAFAYGFVDEGVECAPVSLVTGPGNIYVAAAKRLLKGLIGIDAEAGPTEVAILADDGADPEFIAADMISQAEHDTLAAAVLVTPSADLADAVALAILLVDDLDAGVAVVDAYAAEHLEIHTRDAAGVAARIRNAGAIFVGPHSPVSLGDYVAGSNHVLPTGGSAGHSSGLSVQSFLRGIHIVDYSQAALAEVSEHARTLAVAEDLPAHGEAISARFEERP